MLSQPAQDKVSVAPNESSSSSGTRQGLHHPDESSSGTRQSFRRPNESLCVVVVAALIVDVGNAPPCPRITHRGRVLNTDDGKEEEEEEAVALRHKQRARHTMSKSDAHTHTPTNDDIDGAVALAATTTMTTTQAWIRARCLC